ncbi:MAG TPA: rhomboid family intramembrane serine protease [Blastocatellia bacterium]|nr:rhomboid family intramembrane serine protease [Blastocatellia bacterium]
MDQQIATENLKHCSACGKGIPAYASRCEHCGTEQVESAPLNSDAVRERAFLLALYKRSNPFTYLFLGMNVGVFALMCLAGGLSAMSADNRVLVGFGAKVNELIRANGEYWRFVTSMFIHIGLIHLLFNNYALYIVGQEIERLYGSSRFVLLYLLTGICGSLASYLYTENTSAGASGAIFGLFGVLAAFAFRYRGDVPDVIRNSIKKRVIPLIILNLTIGFSVAQIDNAAHIGGLTSGLLLGFLIPYKRPREKETPLIWRALLGISLAVIFGSLFIAFEKYSGPPLKFENLTSNPQSMRLAYLNGMMESYNSMVDSSVAFQKTIESRGGGDSSTEARAAAERGIRRVNNTPGLPGKGGELRKSLLELLTDQKALVERYGQTGAASWSRAASEQSALNERANRFVEEYKAWSEGN